MSWHFSRALAAAYSEHIRSDYIRYALSSEMSTVDGFLFSDKTMGIFHHSRYGVTYALLTPEHGEELLTSYLADSHVRRLVPLHAAGTTPPTYGLKCAEWSQKVSRPMCLPRTSLPKQLSKQHQTLPRWATKPRCFPLPRLTWVQTTFGKDFGYLHTPTTKANYAALSMQKWPSARNFVTVFGRPTPEAQEWLMAWPVGWTDTKPLEMGKFLSWRQQLCGHLRIMCDAAMKQGGGV